ncbi:MAG: hypothetical protein IPN72_05160 [Saprospiraceae bacterium]|nr:hypothetical protein [Saprospiraceae bacterium]
MVIIIVNQFDDGILVKSWRMAILLLLLYLIYSILFAASWLVGGIDLEAGIFIVFGVVVGIVVDDTIHFLVDIKF